MLNFLKGMLLILIANWKSIIESPFKGIEYNYRVNSYPFSTSLLTYFYCMLGIVWTRLRLFSPLSQDISMLKDSLLDKNGEPTYVLPLWFSIPKEIPWTDCEQRWPYLKAEECHSDYTYSISGHIFMISVDRRNKT